MWARDRLWWLVSVAAGHNYAVRERQGKPIAHCRASWRGLRAKCEALFWFALVRMGCDPGQPQLHSRRAFSHQGIRDLSEHIAAQTSQDWLDWQALCGELGLSENANARWASQWHVMDPCEESADGRVLHCNMHFDEEEGSLTRRMDGDVSLAAKLIRHPGANHPFRCTRRPSPRAAVAGTSQALL